MKKYLSDVPYVWPGKLRMSDSDCALEMTVGESYYLNRRNTSTLQKRITAFLVELYLAAREKTASMMQKGRLR